MCESLIHFHVFFFFIFLLTHSQQESPIRLNSSSVKNRLKGGLRGTEGDKKVLSLFPASRAHYSSSSPLSEMHHHPPPLNYFTFLVPASPPHKPTLCDWLTLGFSSTIAPPPFSHWLFYSLIPATATPSFPFLLPSPLSSPLSPHCWLLALTSSQPKSSSCPFSPLIGL